MTRVALPPMREKGYSDKLATGAIAAGGTLGILIAPSIILLIYGILTGTCIGKLLIAGIIPALLGTLLYIAAVRYTVWREPSTGPVAPALPWKTRLKRLIGIWDVLLLFSVVLGGIYTGWFATIEAAAVGASLSLIAAIIRLRSLRFLPAAIGRSSVDDVHDLSDHCMYCHFQWLY